MHINNGIADVNRKLQEMLMELFDSMDIKIPMPKHTKIFYWKYGVGYWGLRADSNQIAEGIIQPFEIDDIFICGENYSENNQQWMEGALETAEKVISLL